MLFFVSFLFLLRCVHVRSVDGDYFCFDKYLLNNLHYCVNYCLWVIWYLVALILFIEKLTKIDIYIYHHIGCATKVWESIFSTYKKKSFNNFLTPQLNLTHPNWDILFTQRVYLYTFQARIVSDRTYTLCYVLLNIRQTTPRAYLSANTYIEYKRDARPRYGMEVSNNQSILQMNFVKRLSTP